MPQKRNRQEPPPVMTWMKALPVLAVCLIFDVLRLMFEQFWFFGPAFLGIGTSALAGGGVTGTLAGAVVGGAVGFFGAPALIALGVVMAMAVGLAGWLTVGLTLMMTNSRIFKENALWFVSSLALSEVPFIGSLPALTGITYKMYRTQIQKETADMKRYEEEQKTSQFEERQQEAVYRAQQRQFAEQEAANNAQDEIPEERGAAA